jgi:hypothetical protein
MQHIITGYWLWYAPNKAIVLVEAAVLKRVGGSDVLSGTGISHLRSTFFAFIVSNNR